MSDQRPEQYVIQRKLGEGGMGIVYLAEDTMLERPVAIKALHPSLARGADSLGSRFQQEAYTLARLNHPNITHLYAYAPHEDTYWMVMEYVDGKTLEDWLKIKGTLTPAVACSIIAQMLDGLEHAHRKGIIHRDLKPANVMISQEGEVKIMDFGIARIRNSQRLTQHGKSVGTLEYMAPEQIQGKEGDELTDIYGAGNILYELLSGQTPFKSDTDYHLMKAKLEEKAPLSPVLATLPIALQQVIFKALERDPEKRFPDVKIFKATIERSINRPLLTGNELAAALQADSSLTPDTNKTVTYTVSKPKFSLSSVAGKLNLKNIPGIFQNWNTDKSLKLLLAVVVLCTGLLIWNYFRDDGSTDISIATQPLKESKTMKAADTVLSRGSAPPGGYTEKKTADNTVPVPVISETGNGNRKEDIPPEEKPVVKEKIVPKKEEKPKKKEQKPPEVQPKKTEPVVVQKPVESYKKPEPSGPVRVPEGRKITVILDENLSSEERSRDGGPVRLHSAEDVIVDGKTIIRKGAAVTGKIVDVIPSGGRKKALIGFTIHNLQATDGSTIRLRSDRFRQQAQTTSVPSVYRQGTAFTAELGKGIVN
ncbi:MAG: serine/threonine-protein kinase [Bacteroidota bacterium]